MQGNRYDNIEIGTSDFRTLISHAEGTGISVEPVPVYFNNLPDREGWIKVNCAISDTDRKDTVYYVDPEKITSEPDWVRGCNSLGKPHPTILKMYPHLVETQRVDVMSVGSFFSVYKVDRVNFLKIDTEGHDITILRSLLKTRVRPNVIQFESNVLTDKSEYRDIINRLKEYECKRIGIDTFCQYKI